MPVVYMVVRPDRGEGCHKLDVSAVVAYSTYEAASEDRARSLFPSMLRIIEVPVVDAPQTLACKKEKA